jgi:hypothetical protein
MSEDTQNPEPTPTPESPKQPTRGSIPPASLNFLIQTLGSQAIVAMGIVPGPSGEKHPKDLAMGKHFIDMVALLEEKTEGNRTPEESEMLRTWLTQLRLTYVEESK